MINVTFPDGSIKQYDNGITVLEIAKSISSSLAKKCIAARFNDVLVDLSFKLTSDGKLQLLTVDDEESITILNHSSAHVMAMAVARLFDNVKFSIGPAIEEGFYYDIDADNQIKEADLPKIEKEMKKISSEAHPFIREVVSFEQAKEIFKDNPYKQYLIDKINDNGEVITIYRCGEFVDLCRGVHVPNTNKIKHFKLLSIAGAYFLGDSNNIQLQRLYGTSFFKEDDLKKHLEILENRKNNDHRKLGKELDLFTFTQYTGSGLPLWLPNGAVIRNQLERFIKDEELRRGYQHVYTPVLGTKLLYETSGHWDHYKDDMFPVMETDNEEFVLRPMCCPHHAMIYKHKPHSYRELPIRIAELGNLYRYEASGALTGLERVRDMCLNDAHLFVRPDQIKEEFQRVIDLVNYAVSTLELEINYYRLSLRDPENKDKYFDDDAMWNTAEATLEDVLIDNHVNYVKAVDEAAFYGPKLDIQIKTSLGHDLTLATIQLDFLLPQKFELTYIDENNEEQTPVIIHRGIISTMERMTATLIEQYKGAFPLWLSPTQVNFIAVNEEIHGEYVNIISNAMRVKDIRVTVDDRNEKMNKKIRESQVAKVPYTVVIGDNEMENDLITYRAYGHNESVTVSRDEFLDKLKFEIINHVNTNRELQK